MGRANIPCRPLWGRLAVPHFVKILMSVKSLSENGVRKAGIRTLNCVSAPDGAQIAAAFVHQAVVFRMTAPARARAGNLVREKLLFSRNPFRHDGGTAARRPLSPAAVQDRCGELSSVVCVAGHSGSRHPHRSRLRAYIPAAMPVFWQCQTVTGFRDVRGAKVFAKSGGVDVEG